MARALWKGQVIAEAPMEEIEVVEGNLYFPVSAVRQEYLQESDTHTVCPWKGTASYYTIAVNGDRNRDAAWYYPDPKPAASHVKDRIAFWRGVQVER